MWLCECNCGRSRAVCAYTLVAGKTKSCGCRGRGLAIQPGARFGMWSVVRLSSREYGGTCAKWLCRCDCGTERDVWSTSLYNGGSTSCGCRSRVVVEDGLKKCCACGEMLPTTSFYKAVNKQSASGLHSRCKPCLRKVQSGYRLAKKYGLSEPEYERMRAECDSKCEICGSPETESHWGRLAVDHCHSTGKVRGLLCTACNTAIGHLRDSPEIIRKAAEYVERHQP
jgi:hypothetical protein